MGNYTNCVAFLGWLVAVVLLFCTHPPRTPPSAPAGVGLARGFPVHYAAPAPLSYEERFSPEAVGPVKHGLHCQCFDCFPYTLAVNEACEGVGE